MFPHLGPMELVIILVIALMVFGAGKLPEVGSALGKGIKEFKKATTDESAREIAASTATPAPAPPVTQPVAAATTPASTGDATSGGFCPKCGTQAAPGGRFCASCGASLPTPVA